MYMSRIWKWLNYSEWNGTSCDAIHMIWFLIFVTDTGRDWWNVTILFVFVYQFRVTTILCSCLYLNVEEILFTSYYNFYHSSKPGNSSSFLSQLARGINYFSFSGFLTLPTAYVTGNPVECVLHPSLWNKSHIWDPLGVGQVYTDQYEEDNVGHPVTTVRAWSSIPKLMSSWGHLKFGCLLFYAITYIPGANCKSYFISYGQIDVSYGIFPIYEKIYNQNFTSIKNQYCSIRLQMSSLRTIKVRSSIVLCYHKMSLELIP